MCIASFIPGGVEIEEQDLLNGGIANGDGSGWAIAARDRILHGKSMKVEDALDEFVKVRKEYPECPALFHSRWATDGQYGIMNVHPFFMGGSEKTIMCHNGILPCRPGKGDWRSDTRIFADELLSTRYRRLDKPRAFQAMENYCRPSKLIILTVDNPRYKKNAYLVNEKLGHWDELTGIWHSNYDYMGYSGKGKYTSTIKSTYAPVSYRKNQETGVWEPIYAKESTKDRKGYCTYCQYGLVSRAGYCIECGTCKDCWEYREECQCWNGSQWNYKTHDWERSVIGQKAIESAGRCKSAADSAVVFKEAALDVEETLDLAD